MEYIPYQLELEHYKEEGERLGELRGEKRGEIKTLASFVADGIISPTDAANRANMTVTEFKKKAGL